MAGISDLCNEIMLMIIKLVSPDDLESFTLSCRGIYKLATGDLEKHRALKREHTVHRYGNVYDARVKWSPSRLLDEILSKPRTAFYIQEICLHRFRGRLMMSPDPGLRPEDVDLPYSEETNSRVREELSKLATQDEVAEWLWYIIQGSETHIISLFLLLLPNLSKLRITGIDSHYMCLYNTISRITTMEYPGAPLARLHHAQIWGFLDVFHVVAALPSMVSIEGVGLWVSQTEPSLGELMLRTSTVRDLILTKCAINPKVLFRMLGSFRALRSFTFDSYYVRERCQTDVRGKFDPFRLLSGLAVHASSTLESLTVLSHDKGRHFMGDMRSFKNLRNLRTESQLLLSEKDWCPWNTSIAYGLPPQLKSLELECSGQRDEAFMARVIVQLAELKPAYVPGLEKVKVITRNGVKDFNRSKHEPARIYHYNAYAAAENDRYTYESVAAACKAQGFDLSVEVLDPAIN